MKICIFLHAEGEDDAIFHIIFTQPGANSLDNPCCGQTVTVTRVTVCLEIQYVLRKLNCAHFGFHVSLIYNVTICKLMIVTCP